MLAAVSTPHFLLAVDIESHTLAVIESHRREYYGISWRPDCHDLVLSHSGLDNGSLTDLTSYSQSEVGWISVGASDCIGALSQPHQILVGSDGRVICTNTGRNSLLVLDPDAPGYFQESRLHRDRWDRLTPDQRAGLHINSLFEAAGVLSVVAHGFQSGSRLIRLAYPSLTLLAEEPIHGFTGLHNYCRFESGAALACGSPQGMLIDPHSGECCWRSDGGGYLRGLAVGPDHVIVGVSPNCSRAERGIVSSQIAVIDRQSWQAVDVIELGPFGVVHDIRLLDLPDEAHHGHPFLGANSLREKLQDPAAHRSLPPPSPQVAPAVSNRRLAVFIDPTPRTSFPDQFLQVMATRFTGSDQPLKSELILATAAGQTPNTVGLSSRTYEWETLDAATATRALAYAGCSFTIDQPALVPNDGIRHFLDCSLWVFLSPPADGLILPLRPFVILLPIPPEELFQLPLTASLGINLRHARKIMVTESATAEALVREVGVAQERITLIEHPLPRQAAVFEGTAALIDLLDSLLVPDP